MMTTQSRKTDNPQNFELKPLSKEGLGAALEKAGKYRLLNEPMLAESICLDILGVDPGNERATIELLLALTDQFSPGSTRTAKRAMELAKTFRSEYLQHYYNGIIHERQGTAALKSNVPGCEFDAYEWYIEAMELYEKSEAIMPSGNEDPVLRWNTCARIINDHNLGPRPPDNTIHLLE